MNEIEHELPADGATHVAVNDRDGKVVLMFPTPVTWVALDPQIAPHIAESMIQAARRCGVEVTIEVPQKQISPNKYAALVVRIALVMENLKDRGKGKEFIANELVDIVLKEVM